MKNLSVKNIINPKELVKPGKFVWLILIVMLIASSVSSPIFLTSRNLRNVFLIQPIGLAIATMAQSVVMISGNIDMSIASAVSLMTTMAAGLFRDIPDISPFTVSLLLLLTGIAIGALNGFMAVILRIPAFMATLATSSLLQGVIFFYTKRPIGGIPKSFRFLASYKVAGIPICFFYFLIIFLVMAALLNRHRFGNHLYATGSDDYIAGISGIPVVRVKMQAYLLGGALVALASIFLSSRMGGGGPTTGDGYELDTITAAVIGGISLAGGEGKLMGAIGGVFILMIFSNFMNLMDINPYIQMFLKGMILILAVAFYAKKDSE
ncbi:MAG: ABC transporter permease [Spirochaetales bacterium]|nr:ABC transporter permease [Spirochaetales bacterium]